MVKKNKQIITELKENLKIIKKEDDKPRNEWSKGYNTGYKQAIEDIEFKLQKFTQG